MDELKPCPFCGAPAELRSPDFEIEVHCSQCAAKMENAPEFWNRRADTRPAPSPADAGLVERLRARRPTQRSYLYGTLGGRLINPDGPEAAARIEALSGGYERGVEDAEEAGAEAYRQGYRDGFVDARFPEGHPGDERDAWRDIDSVAIADGWQNYRDTFIRNLRDGGGDGQK